MRIISIDPGYERLGVAIIEKNQNSKGCGLGKEKLIYSSCLRTPSTDSFEDRLVLIGDSVQMIIDEYKPQALSIENLFISKNQKTAMRVSEVRGAIIYICKKSGLNIFEYTPLQIKLAVTGDGKSSKEQVIKMVDLIVGKLKNKALDDEYDAIAVGLAHFAYYKNNTL